MEQKWYRLTEGHRIQVLWNTGVTEYRCHGIQVSHDIGVTGIQVSQATGVTGIQVSLNTGVTEYMCNKIQVSQNTGFMEYRVRRLSIKCG